MLIGMSSSRLRSLSFPSLHRAVFLRQEKLPGHRLRFAAQWSDHHQGERRLHSLASRGRLGFAALRTFDVVCWSSGNGASENNPVEGKEREKDGEGNGADIDEENSEDDEIEPLRDALERAKVKAGKSSVKREALEAEAQNIAELAMEALEGYESAKQALRESIKTKEENLLEKEHLNHEIDSLKSHISLLQQLRDEISSHDESDELASLDSFLTTNGDSVVEDEEKEIEEEEPPKKAKELRTLQSVDIELTDLLSTLSTTQTRLSELNRELIELENKIPKQNEKVRTCKKTALEAEARVQAVMQAAQTAVTAELESKAVLKETKNAFINASMEIDVLSSQELDLDETQRRLKEDMDEVIKEQKDLDEEETLESTSAVVVSSSGEPTDAGVLVRTTPVVVSAHELLFQNLATFALNNRWLFVAGCVVLASALVLMVSPLRGKIIAKLALMVQKLISRPAEILSALLPENYGAEAGFIQTIWLLLSSVVMVPLVCELLPGGTPVLGFLLAGAIVGPHALGIIKNVEEVRHLAELGVVFLLFNIGLELSLERLRSMAKFVFGMGTAQVLLTTAAVGSIAAVLAGLPGPSAVILGAGLALSSTAVAMQVLQERNESGSRHGRATFSILLLQDLAVVVVLMLIPLLSQQNNSTNGGIMVILKALGVAAVKAVVCITGIILGGRVLVRPIYNLVAHLENKEIFAALTLLVVLGTSELTQVAGLSLALGAFLAGLLLAETEYVIQVESDIEPYKGLLMGLFFMTVGMEISVGLMISQWRTIAFQLTFLLFGKIAIMAVIGPIFGLSRVSALRSGLMLAPGGEFAFVAFGEAASLGVLPTGLVTQLYLVVSLSMALLPYLADFGAKLGKIFETGDMKAMTPNEDETGYLNNHIIIAGFGRVGQLISQLLSERLIPFVAVDVMSQRVQYGKNLDLPVYFGDAGSQQVLHSIGAARAACMVVVLDSPGSNYRCVWTMKRHFPHVKTYVRAFDMDHARNLERAGAAVVVPETLEPSLQIAASVLAQVKVPEEEIGNILDEFRRDHFAELESLSKESGYSLGYGFSRGAVSSMDSTQPNDKDENERNKIKAKVDDDAPSTDFGGIVATP